MQALQAYLRDNRPSSTFALPSPHAAPPSIRWSGPVTDQFTLPSSTLPNGVIIPITHASLGVPLRDRLVAVDGNPTLSGYVCRTVSRPYTCRGVPQSTSSRIPVRIVTDAPVIELTGVVPDNGGAVPVLIVDGQLVQPTALAASRGSSGWTAGTLVVDFGTRAKRDIWIEAVQLLAYLKIDTQDTLYDANPLNDPQFTVVGDSYLQTHSNAFPCEGGIALEIAARLGIRKIAVDSVGGTGYYNTSSGLGSLNDRLSSHAADNSLVYVVMAGLNDYADASGWPTRADYERSVYDYLKNLRAAQPKALIVVTAPFCPIPPLSDSTWMANPATNTSGIGDYLYKAALQKDAVQQIAGPWVYIDVLMGGGWLNSSGNTGDITHLQWLTGGDAPHGGTLGGGGGFGGIRRIPIVSGGKYSRGPNMTATGGSGEGLRISGVIDSAGALTAVTIYTNGNGYSAGAGLPTIAIDPTYEITPAVLGTPELTQSFNPTGEYPLGYNNIDQMISEDRTHPSPVGVAYLGQRLAENIYQAVMAL